MQWIRSTNACVLSVYEAVVIVSELVLTYVSAEIVNEGEESAGRVGSGAPRCVRIAGVPPHDALPVLLDDGDAHLRLQGAYAGRV